MPNSANDDEPETPGSLPPARAARRAVDDLVPGTIIEGKYRVERVLGRGGMGVVVAATHLDLDQRVALKFLEPRDGQVPHDFHGRFTLEARVCAKLRNEHIARVQDVGIWRGQTPFMVMDYVEGADLRRRLRIETRIPFARAVEYALQICDGLAEAHAQGIIHRDLKPANIFVTSRPDGSELVKVLDFGISKWAQLGGELSELTEVGVVLGSPKYMSPEQLTAEALDPRADVWSIGAILYAMLTGRAPYDSASAADALAAIVTGKPLQAPSKLEPSIPPALDAVVLRCLARDRDQRVMDVAQLAGELLEAIGSPFAAEVRERLATVLEPSRVSSLPRARLGSMTTGTYAVFASRSSTMPAPPAPSIPPPQEEVSGRGRAMPWMWGLAAAAFVALVGVAARAPDASFGGTGVMARAPRARTPSAKQLAREAPAIVAAVTSPATVRPLPHRPSSPAPAPHRPSRALPEPAAAHLALAPVAAAERVPPPTPPSAPLDDRF